MTCTNAPIKGLLGAMMALSSPKREHAGNDKQALHSEADTFDLERVAQSTT